tara:strand:- start:489 stop:698 length:210 start_codon:yes stop_codon:yes gene_type:complete
MYKDICHLYRNFGNVVAGKLVMLNNVVKECNGDKESSYKKIVEDNQLMTDTAFNTLWKKYNQVRPDIKF